MAQKGQALRAALAPYVDLAPELLPPRAASGVHAYRLRAKLVSSGTALGLFERGSHRVVDVSGCRVLSPELTAATEAVRRLLPLPIYGADLRQTSQGVQVTLLSETPRARAELERAGLRLVEGGHALSAAISFRRAGDARFLAGVPQMITGPSEARHALAPGAPYGYAAHGGFVQAHAGQASYVCAEIARGQQARLEVEQGARVLELFAGNGSLALALARAGARVTAVESYAPAIQLAERAAREQGLELSAVAGDATHFASRLEPHDFDAVVVNPPRRGLTPALRRALARAEPRALAYVSCNPHTLARDAWHLSLLGLRLERAEPLDMIPWSDAVEVLSWFVPAPIPKPRVLFEDAQLLAVEKPPHEAEDSLVARVRGLPGCAEARSLDGWGAGVSGVCWFEKRPSSASAAERELLLACRGNLRKQGTITRRAAPGSSRYRKQAELGRHSLVRVTTLDADERGTTRDFAGIRHPVLGDAAHGDPVSNDFLQHRHGLERPFLHVQQSALRLPSGVVVQARSELAPDLEQVLASLSSDQPELKSG